MSASGGTAGLRTRASSRTPRPLRPARRRRSDRRDLPVGLHRPRCRPGRRAGAPWLRRGPRPPGEGLPPRPDAARGHVAGRRHRADRGAQGDLHPGRHPCPGAAGDPVGAELWGHHGAGPRRGRRHPRAHRRRDPPRASRGGARLGRPPGRRLSAGRADVPTRRRWTTTRPRSISAPTSSEGSRTPTRTLRSTSTWPSPSPSEPDGRWTSTSTSRTTPGSSTSSGSSSARWRMVSTAASPSGTSPRSGRSSARGPGRSRS